MSENKKILLHDLALIVPLLVLSVLSVFLFSGKKEGCYVRIEVEGKEYGLFNLNCDGVYSVNTGANVITIENKSVFISNADCPDKICVKQGRISKSGQTIVCLPNRLKVSIINEKGGVDIVL